MAHATAPLAIPSAIAAAAAFDALISTLSEQPQVTLQTRGEGYAHLTCRSRLFRFVDDLELSLDEAARCIHVRSASRVGHSDFGVNRRRVERLRKLLGSLTAP